LELKIQLNELKKKLEENKDDFLISMLLSDKIKEIEIKLKGKKKKRIANRTIKYLTNDEFSEVINEFDKIKKLKNTNIKTQNFNFFKRDKIILLLAYECGLRASETSNLRKDDFHEKNREIFCRRLKGSRNNTVKLTISTSKLLKTYLLENPNDTNYIFLSRQKNRLTRQQLTNICKKYFALAGISKEKQHFHTLKHTAGVHLAEQGLDIKEVQYILGHRNVENTMIYFDFTTKQQKVLYDKLGRN